jgi:hypothetical protein
MSELNGSSAIQSGTAEGLLQFLDYVVDKKYGTSSAVHPLKSAARQVFSMIEGDDYGSVDVRELNLEEYLRRFATGARGNLKEESIRSYQRRFERAHEAYLDFVQTGKTPAFRDGPRASTAARKMAARHKTGSRKDSAEAPAPEAPSPALGSGSGAPREPMIEYPFPLRSGQVAGFRLPVRLEKDDAERMATFIRSLVFEPMKQIGQGTPEAGTE